MIRNWKTTLCNYRHAALLLYFVPYMLWFGWLQGNARPEHWAGSWIDTLIPFQEIFVIPYLLWFFYVAATVGYFLVCSKPDYFRLCAFLFGGMTVCLAIYTVFPNGQILRPLVFPRDNLLTDAVRTIYLADPPINVCPSIHCFNSIGVNIAIRRSELGRRHKAVRWGSEVLMVLICMSTVFIKQHSIADVFAAILLAVPFYFAVYRGAELARAFRPAPIRTRKVKFENP